MDAHNGTLEQSLGAVRRGDSQGDYWLPQLGIKKASINCQAHCLTTQPAANHGGHSCYETTLLPMLPRAAAITGRMLLVPPQLSPLMKPTHGGARPGAGRKPTSKAKRSLTIRLSEAARTRLDAIKQATGESASSVLERALRLL